MLKMSTNNECMERSDSYVCICGEGFVSNQFSIQCDYCKDWFHGLCVGLHELESEEIDKYYCHSCESTDTRLRTLHKPITNNWRHNRTEGEPKGKAVQSGTELFVTNLKNTKFIDAKTDESVVKRMRGQQLTLKEVLLNGFSLPILVESKDGLELTVPSNTSFNYKSILDYYSPNYELDVIDVRRQLNIKMKAQDFVRNFSLDCERRPNVFNCISLEVSNSRLSDLVRAPNIVNKLSWVDNYWPPMDAKPSVSKYCLISMKDSFTDFHIDFGGTSVWYHVLSGEKVFYIIKPEKQNLEEYEKWMTSSTTSEHFFADIVGHNNCFRLSLTAGQTLFVPTGWIHAVLTPQDSVVFGGNFLHSFNIELQLKIREMEHRIKTPFKFQFPFFEMTHWYAAPNVLKLLQDNLKQHPPKHLVHGVTALIPQLKVWHKKSKEFQNQNEYQISSLAPKGFNCIKLIKDLNLTLKKAIRKIEGHPMIKKRGKSYKDFNLETKDLPLSSALMSGNPLDRESSERVMNTNNMDIDLDDRDVSLVVDDSSKVADRTGTHSTDSESKGSLKLKLSISGAKEILGTNQSLDSTTNETINTSNDNIFGMKSTLNQNIESNKKQKNQRKRKKDSSDQQLEDEIESMVRGRPQDDDYIYLDLETPEDEANRPQTAVKDESWAPKAKVNLKSTPKPPRPPRDSAKRDVVETSIANAAAKIENMPQPKRQYVKKKPKLTKTVVSSDRIESSVETNVNIDSIGISTLASNPTNTSSTESSAIAPKPIPTTSSQQQVVNRKPKKGLKTPKQRLHKIICQKKRTHF